MRIRKIILILIIIISALILGNTVYANDDIVVMLDPGHGGSDSGAVGGKLVEKTINWKIANYVKDILNAEEGVTAYLTREENENPSLYERGLLAKKKGANLLVSFHVNSSNFSNRLSGTEVYITANTNSARFFESTNKLGQDILNNLQKELQIPAHIYTPIRKYSTDGELYTDGFLSDYYGIIRNPMYYGIPGILIEHCYINNEYDRVNYLNDEMLEKIAIQDANAIIDNKNSFKIDRNNNAVNASLDNIVVNDSNKYMQGELTVIDWINGMQCIPEIKMKLKSDDGVVKECFVNPLGGYRFYFDVNIAKLDLLKEYYLEIETLDKVNIPTRHTIKLSFKDKEIGKINGVTAKCSDNKIVFDGVKYEGNINTDLEDIRLETTSYGKQYITGEMIIVEWIDGQSNIPNPLPKMTLVSTDSEKTYKINLLQKSGHMYSFNTNEYEQIDTSKQYEIIIESTNRNNVAEGKKGVVRLPEEKIGMYSNYTMTTKENKIIYSLENYGGEISTELLNINLIKNATGADYITGNIIIQEHVENQTYKPFTKPKITLIDEDGKEISECYINYIDGFLYYFDRNITGIDSNKKYSIKVELTENNNVSIEKTENVNFKDYKIIGKLKNYNFIVYDETIEITEKYKGDVNSEVLDIQYAKTNYGADYIMGEIVIVEWINGKSTVPETLPKIILENVDGEYLGECYVNQIAGHKYYFDKNITGIKTDTMYRLKIILTEPNNISENKTMNMNFTETKTLTTMGEYRFIAGGLVLYFNNNYRGNINSEIKYININETEDGRKYISGNIVIVEWINYFNNDIYTSTVPITLPKMTLKDEDGNSYNMFINQVSGHLYYFDKFIDNLDTNKKYYIEVELTDKSNMSGFKKMNAYFGPSDNFAGKAADVNMYTNKNEIRFEFEK